MLSAIIITYNSKHYLPGCLDSLALSFAGLDYEIIIVDNKSTDGAPEFIKTTYPYVRLIENDVNLGYAAACNIGIRSAKGKFILILNSDVILLDKLNPVIDYLEQHDEIGLVGCSMYNRRMERANPLRVFPTFVSEFYKLTLSSIKRIDRTLNRHNNITAITITEVDWVEGCFMLAKKDSLQRVGLMDERFFFYYEDLDLCYSLKIDSGLKVIHYPFMRFIHSGGGSSNFNNSEYLQQYYESSIKYLQKRYGFVRSYIFAKFCIIAWLIMYLLLFFLHIITQKSQRLDRKLAMLNYVLRMNLFDKRRYGKR